MKFPPRSSRALLLGLSLGLTACDVVKFASDPPRLIQTWNVPMSQTVMSVASLLPTGVAIYSTPASNPPDSSAFSVTINPSSFSQTLANDCAACLSKQGTTDFKPTFTLIANTTSNLPSRVDSAAIATGSVNLNITNNLTFDPLYVNTLGSTTQGVLTITIKSGSQVLVLDSIFGAATTSTNASGRLFRPFDPGNIITRTYTLPTGLINSSLKAELVFNSPAGDHKVPIDVNRKIDAVFTVPALNVSWVRIQVPGTPLTNGSPTDLPDDLDKSLTDHVIGGQIEMQISNPFTITGNLAAQFKYGPTAADTVLKLVPLPPASPTPSIRSVVLDSLQMAKIFTGAPTQLTLTGNVSSPTPIRVRPKEGVAISNRLVLSIRVGSSD